MKNGQVLAVLTLGIAYLTELPGLPLTVLFEKSFAAVVIS